MTSPVKVHVADHSFGVFDRYEIPIETADWSTGLIVAMSSGAMIYTGIDRGYVRVTVDVRAAAPEQIDGGPWDDIVEATVYSPHGDLQVDLLEYPPDDSPLPFPVLSSQGSGSYRLRAHARGRDLHFDAVQIEPTEDYLLTIWPADPAPHLIIRATDGCGFGLRLSDAERPKNVTAPALPPEAIAEQEHREFLRQALLRSMTSEASENPPVEGQ